jgi:hypothetical protein
MEDMKGKAKSVGQAAITGGVIAAIAVVGIITAITLANMAYQAARKV